MIDDMNSDYACSCIAHTDEIVHCDTGRVCMFGINPISTRFIQYGHKWKLKEHSYITWHNFWGEKKIREKNEKPEKNE